MSAEPRRCELATVSLGDNDYDPAYGHFHPTYHTENSNPQHGNVVNLTLGDFKLVPNGSRSGDGTSALTDISVESAATQIDQGSDTDFCVDHEVLLDVFCSTDKKLICSQCAIAGSCKGHIVSPVAQRASVVRNQLVDICEKMQLQAMRIERFVNHTLSAKGQALQTEASAARECVIARLGLVREALEEEEQRLLEAVQREEERVQQCLLTQKAHWTQALDSLTRTRTHLVHTLTHANDMKLARSSQDIADSVEEADSAPEPRDTEQLNLNTSCSDSKLMLGLWASVALSGPSGHTAACLTFDERTVSPQLSLSSDLLTVTYLPKRARRMPQYDPARFDGWPNVLCSQPLSSGLHSWVLEVGHSAAFKVGVCYASMERKGTGDASRLGYNAHSWVLSHFEGQFSFCHAGKHLFLPLLRKPRRLGVLLDWPGRTLLFFEPDYGVTLHAVCHAFSAPLLPACAVADRSVTLIQR